MLPRLLLACLALGLVAPAAADPRQDLRMAYVSNLALKSYKATMIDVASNQTLSTFEFQAPARKYRFRSNTAEQVSSSTVWIGAASGHVLQVETSGKHDGKPYAMRMVYSDFNSPSIRINPPK